MLQGCARAAGAVCDVLHEATHVERHVLQEQESTSIGTQNQFSTVCRPLTCGRLCLLKVTFRGAACSTCQQFKEVTVQSSTEFRFQKKKVPEQLEGSQLQSSGPLRTRMMIRIQ